MKNKLKKDNFNNNFKKYIVFWLSQALSQLGSAMTGFALVLWIYMQEGTAMTVSLMLFFNYMPYAFVSLFAGSFVDNHRKKTIVLVADCLAAMGSAAILMLCVVNRLQFWHIYLVNFLIGCMNAFQTPASSVMLGMIVPKDRLSQVSGMNSFSGNMVTVLSPVLSSLLFTLGGLKFILIFDLGSFLVAWIILLLVIKIPNDISQKSEKKAVFEGCREGFRFLHGNKGILKVILTMALLNFFSRLTYENILSPMILARSGNSTVILGIVNAVMGGAGILGGIIVATGKVKKDSVKMIYVSAMFSFLWGDVMMGIGRNLYIWSFAAFAASFPIAFINAGQSLILYHYVPEKMQGRIFAVRNALQFSTIPLAILLGGLLADYVLEPFMQTNCVVANLLRNIVGSGTGSGMAVMFLCTGILGALFSFVSYRQKDIRNLVQDDV